MLRAFTALRTVARASATVRVASQTRSISLAARMHEKLYTESHEWVEQKGDNVVVGITEFAQEQLGDIVYVGVPEEGAELGIEEEFGTVESVKAASDLLSPVTGTVVAVNEELGSTPQLINESAEGDGWMIEMTLDNPSELEGLMSAEAYQTFLKDNE
eukprot:m.41590 g.41590  ORF g.41590 m.41590 type:complete len:158 (-) comp10587_c1_seq2:1850-2323(-)